MDYRHVADRASAARAVIATASTSEKNAALLAIRDTMVANHAKILATFSVQQLFLISVSLPR